MYTSTITLKFNQALRDDPHGIYSVFYNEHFNTPKAELITEGRTYQTTSVSFQVPNFPPGRKLAFRGIGRYLACHVENVRTIEPGENDVWLIAFEEVNYGV